MGSILSDLITAIAPTPTRGLALAMPTITHLVAQGTPLQNIARKAQGLNPLSTLSSKLSANAIINQVRSIGFKVRRKTTLAFIKTLRQQTNAYDYISSITKGAMPLASKIPYSPYPQRLKYQYTVTLTGEDALTGDLRTQFIRINSPRLITKNKAIAAAVDIAINQTKYNLADITDSDVPLIARQNPLLENT